MNLSGVGCPELGSLLLMPTTGDLSVDYKEYGSTYKNENATPGYYSNELTKYGIKCEVSATPRTSIARFTFPEGQSNILMNLGEGLTNESGATVRRVSATEIEGESKEKVVKESQTPTRSARGTDSVKTTSSKAKSSSSKSSAKTKSSTKTKSSSSKSSAPVRSVRSTK